MLIVYKFKIELTIIWLLLILRRGEEFHNVVFGKQGTAQNSHDLHDWTSKFEIVFNDSDETVCDDGNMNLNTYGIVTLSPERLNPEVLLDPFEKQLDLPPVFIKEGDVLGGKIEVVRVVSERSVQLWSIVDDTPDFSRILLLVLFLREDNGLVTQDIVRSIKDVRTINDFVVRPFLLTNDEEGSGYGNLIKSGEVKIASVKDIACQRLVCEPVHSVDIMHVSIGNSVEHGNLRDDIHLRVDFDARLRTSELSPAKERHAEVDSRRVNGIESAVQLKLSCNPSLLCKEYHVESKLLKDAIVSEAVDLGKRTLFDGSLSESEMKRLLSMGGCYICEFPKSATTHKLSEHKDEKLTPVRRGLALGPVVELDHKAFEIPLWKKAGYLSENVLSDMHKYPKFDLGAKVRISKVRQGFCDLLCCA